MATVDTPLKETQQTVRVPVWTGNRDTSMRQRFVNCYPKKEYNPVSGSDGFHIVRRPGVLLQEHISVTINWAPYVNDVTKCAWVGLCGFASASNLMVGAVFDSSNGTIYVLQIPVNYIAAPVLIGTITGFSAVDPGGGFYCTADFIHLTEICFQPANVPILGLTIGSYAIGGTTRGYTATSAGGVFAPASLTQIAAAGFPANIANTQITGPFVQMQNFVFIATRKGAIYWSNSASATLWTSLDNINAMTDVDFLFGLGRYKHHLMAYGDKTIEFFNVEYENTTGAILIPTQQARIKIGVPNSYGYATVADTLYFVGKTDAANISMYKLEGYTPTKIKNIETTFVVDVQYVGSNYPRLQVASLGGIQHLCLNVPGYNAPYPPYAWASLSADSTSISTDDYPDEYCTQYEPFGYLYDVGSGQSIFSPDTRGLLMFNTESEEFWTYNFFNPYRGIYNEVAGGGVAVSWKLLSADWLAGSQIEHMWVMNHALFNYNEASYPFSAYIPNSTNQSNGVHSDATPNYDRDIAYGAWPISVFFSSEYMDFGNSKRKKIHRLTLEGDNRNFYVPDPESLRIYWKHDQQGSVDPEQSTDYSGFTFGRTVPIPNLTRPRWSVSNLGSARTWAFGVWIVTASNIQIRSWELEVSQGAS